MARTLRRSASTASLDLSELGRLLQDLEQRMSQVAAYASANARQAGSTVPDRLADALSDVSDRIRQSLPGLRQNARYVGEEATRLGNTAWHRVEDEVVHRPFVALAIAAAIGFMIGALNRR